MDEGLGGGGNAYGYSYIIATLDVDAQVKQFYEIFGRGKFSYGHLEIEKVESGKILAAYTQNPMAYTNSEEIGNNSKSLPFIFYVEDNQLKEERYQKCPLAAMQKAIFKEGLHYTLKRKLSLDDSFNEEQQEWVTLANQPVYYASLSGCEVLRLYFSKELYYDEEMLHDAVEAKKQWLAAINFFIENTRFKTVFTDLKKELENLYYPEIKPSKRGKGMYVEIELSNSWTTRLFLSGNAEQGNSLGFQLTKDDSNGDAGFWELLEKKNCL